MNNPSQPPWERLRTGCATIQGADIVGVLAERVGGQRGAERLLEVAEQFFAQPLHEISAPSLYAGGGQEHVLIEQSGGCWCVRCWPEEWSRERLAWLHELLVCCEGQGFTLVPKVRRTPEGRTIVVHDGSVYDVQSWPAGEPMPLAPYAACLRPLSARRRSLASHPGAGAVAYLRQLAQIAIALAQFHQLTRLLEPSPAASRPLWPHLDQLFRHDIHTAGMLGLAIQREAETAESRTALQVIDLVLLVAHKLSNHQTLGLGAYADTSIVGLNDLRPIHTHVRGRRFAGWSSVAQAAFSSPVVDLAQLIVHFSGWHSRGRVLQAYAAVRPLTRDDQRLVPVAVALELASEALGVIAYREARPDWFGAGAPVVFHRRLREIGAQLRAVHAGL